MKNFCWAFALVMLCTSAQAGQRRICDLTVKILKVNAAKGTLRASVQKLDHGTAHAGCPLPGQVLEFSPETLDYQAMLPRRRWPGMGETAALQVRYLDGQCHREGGDGPCRIVHYPMPR